MCRRRGVGGLGLHRFSGSLCGWPLAGLSDAKLTSGAMCLHMFLSGPGGGIQYDPCCWTEGISSLFFLWLI